MSLRILVVDDEKLSRVTTAKQLNSAGYIAESHETPFSALKALNEGNWDVVLTDQRMPSMDGIEFLKEIRMRSDDTAVILMTAYGTVKTAVEAMREGAFDYLTKPFDIDELKLRLDRIEERMDNRREIATLRRALGSSTPYHGLVGNSPKIRDVFELIERFADNPSNVLIMGETGTGKELAARALHTRSPRSKGPFIAVGCAAVPRDLAESELFGHEAGSFTGAMRQRKGRFEMAKEGTLFLDDVDDLPIELQAKLLRAIQEKQFERVGGEQTIKTDVRIISATKSDLGEQVKKEKFREDLMYRLKVLEVRLPPLRERREDILLLSKHFLARISKERNIPCKVLSPETSRSLVEYNWPGNVRELQHAMEYAQAISKGDLINPEDLPSNLQTGDRKTPYTLNLEGMENLDFRSFMENIEKDIFQWALNRANGHQGKAAELLGIPRTTLQSRMNAK